MAGRDVYIAHTHRVWFDFLSRYAQDGRLDEVNFWFPNAQRPPRDLPTAIPSSSGSAYPTATLADTASSRTSGCSRSISPGKPSDTVTEPRTGPASILSSDD